jgi:hypothetical protein
MGEKEILKDFDVLPVMDDGMLGRNYARGHLRRHGRSLWVLAAMPLPDPSLDGDWHVIAKKR